MKTLSDLLVVIAAVVSMAESALGFSVGSWGGALWSNRGMGAILNLLLWLLPTCSIFAFLSYLLSRSVGLKCAWAIAIGSIGTAICSLASAQFTPIVFLFPLLQLIASFALYGDTLIQNKITAGRPGYEANRLPKK
jgi:hypothetical protein